MQWAWSFASDRPFWSYALGCGFMRRGARQHGIVGRGLIFVVVRINVVLAHGVVFELFPHEQAAQVGVAREDDSVEIEDFALLKFRAAPDGRERRQVIFLRPVFRAQTQDQRPLRSG